MDKDRAYQLWLMEELLDSLGIVDFIEMLSEICYAKAEHVRTNWQDVGLARLWEDNAKVLLKMKIKECY